MSDTTDDSRERDESVPAKKMSLAERAKQARKEQYQKAKEKQKAYLASPEVQKRLNDRKEAMQKMRRERSEQFRANKKALNAAAKKSLAEDAKSTRAKRQAERDLELQEKVRPAFTLIQGGAQS